MIICSFSDNNLLVSDMFLFLKHAKGNIALTFLAQKLNCSHLAQLNKFNCNFFYIFEGDYP